MSTSSNNQGRAYEYAWINTLYEALQELRKTRILNNSSYMANENAWNSIGSDLQETYIISANAAVDTVLELEPKMTEPGDNELTLEFQQDAAGRHGDVRDIVIKLDDTQWEIGLSIKHNHDAAKHSRLSHQLDFGQEWYGRPCSSTYWNAILPIFDRLFAEKEIGTKWSEIADKEDSIYYPLLNAFMDEVQRAYENDKSLPYKMVEYIIGIEDYYKIVSHDNKCLTLIHTFNMHGTLNKRSKIKVSAITVPVVSLPTELIAIKHKTGSKNTVEAYFNNGWQLNFRIHNASTEVEPSLKFDIQFTGMPTSILNLECHWIKQ